MTKMYVGLTVTVFSLVLIGSVFAGPVEREERTVTVEKAKDLVVEIEFGAGKFALEPRDMADAGKLKVEYEPEYVSFDVDYKERESTGYVRMESDFRRRHHDDDIENRWDLALSTRYPMELDLSIGACDARMDLGGIPIRMATVEIGAADGLIEFRKPNPERMEEFNFDIGAASVELQGLANANFEYLDLEIGAASCDIDLSGEFEGESVIELDVGAGSADFLVPEDLAIAIEADTDGWFSSVDFEDLDLEKVSRGRYESEGFQDAKKRIVIMVDVGFGSVDFHRGR